MSEEYHFLHSADEAEGRLKPFMPTKSLNWTHLPDPLLPVPIATPIEAVGETDLIIPEPMTVRTFTGFEVLHKSKGSHLWLTSTGFRPYARHTAPMGRSTIPIARNVKTTHTLSMTGLQAAIACWLSRRSGECMVQ